MNGQMNSHERSRGEILNWIARFVFAGLLIQPVMLVLDVIVVYPVLGGRTFIATFPMALAAVRHRLGGGTGMAAPRRTIDRRPCISSSAWCWRLPLSLWPGPSSPRTNSPANGRAG
jgi:hypothetical protein